jgi:hypothetical protein
MIVDNLYYGIHLFVLTEINVDVTFTYIKAATFRLLPTLYASTAASF